MISAAHKLGGSGRASTENFEKMCNLVRYRVYFD